MTGTHIVVASTNPVKLRAVESAFRRMFPGETLRVSGSNVPSLVAQQPFSDAETLSGAQNRVAGAQAAVPQADFWVGVEGGVEENPDGLTGFAWIVVRSRDRTGQSRSGTFLIPPRVADLIRGGMELGDADDVVFGRSNSKQENGAIGLLTRDVLDRVALYEHAVILALVPFRNPDLYPA
jgi:inosine/xanthosine triphosphatase